MKNRNTVPDGLCDFYIASTDFLVTLFVKQYEATLAEAQMGVWMAILNVPQPLENCFGVLVYFCWN